MAIAFESKRYLMCADDDIGDNDDDQGMRNLGTDGSITLPFQLEKANTAPKKTHHIVNIVDSAGENDNTRGKS